MMTGYLIFLWDHFYRIQLKKKIDILLQKKENPNHQGWETNFELVSPGIQKLFQNSSSGNHLNNPKHRLLPLKHSRIV